MFERFKEMATSSRKEAEVAAEAPAVEEKAADENGTLLKVLDAIEALSRRIEVLEKGRPLKEQGANPAVTIYEDKTTKIEAIKIQRAGAVLKWDNAVCFCPGIGFTESPVQDGCIRGLELDRNMPVMRR